MICDPHTHPDQTLSLIVSHVAAEIETACAGDASTFSSAHEMARAIECFLQQEGCPEFVDSRTLTLLAARALSSIGEPEAARRLILFGTGMVRPSQWVVTGDRAVWVLDLKEMTVWNDAPLELLFFKGVQLAVESIADVWDECRGDGILGLRHICSAASAVLGAPLDTAGVDDLAAEIKDVCLRKLEQLCEARGWVATPRVMNLDM